MSSTERNKVKSFGDPSIAHGKMADRFLIVGAFNAPPPVTNRVKGGGIKAINNSWSPYKEVKNHETFT